MMAMTALVALGGPPGNPSDWRFVAGIAVAYVFINGLFFLMLYTGKTSKYRRIFFVAMSLGFVLTFIANLIETRGSMALKAEDMLGGETPFCHMVIPTTVVPAALSRTIIFPGSMEKGFANISSMLVIWIVASLALGRGWCSWACFFGGMDEGFSRLLRKPRIRKISSYWRYLPFAVLLGIVLTSAATLSPTYCEWLCPFKAVTEFPEINSALVAVQTAIFVSLFAGLVIVLPALTRRCAVRTFLSDGRISEFHQLDQPLPAPSRPGEVPRLRTLHRRLSDFLGRSQRPRTRPRGDHLHAVWRVC